MSTDKNSISNKELKDNYNTACTADTAYANYLATYIAYAAHTAYTAYTTYTDYITYTKYTTIIKSKLDEYFEVTKEDKELYTHTCY